MPSDDFGQSSGVRTRRVWVVAVDRKAVVAFKAVSQREARELLVESWFKQELAAQGRWSTGQKLVVRSTDENESAAFTTGAKDVAETDEVTLVFLP
jgi:hypothetical protein